MKTKIFILSAIVFLFECISCSSELKNLETPRNEIPAASFFTFSGYPETINTFKESWPSLFYPNCVTPNELGPFNNEYFYVIISPGSLQFSLANFTIYNKHKKVIAELNETTKWDCKIDNKVVEDGNYGFSVYIIFEKEKAITAFGVFLVKTCFSSEDSVNELVFGDQIHPRLGVIYETREEFVFCD